MQKREGNMQKRDRKREKEGNRLPIFQSHLTCPVLWAVLSSSAGEWEASMHAHALRKEGQRQRWVVEGGGHLCVLSVTSCIMSPFAGNCEQG